MHRYVLALLIVASPFSAFAAELPKEGSYDFNSCWSGVNNAITFSKTYAASTFEMTGTTRSNPPGGMFDKSTFRCVGLMPRLTGRSQRPTYSRQSTWTATSDLLSFSNVDGKITRTNVAGTGKYEGIVTAGTVELLGRFRPSRTEPFKTAIIRPARIG